MVRRALVVADDLTGAMDSGHEFAARGFETVLALGGGDPNEEKSDTLASEVLVVDTDSRSATAEEARRVVERVIDTHPAEVLYKKIDSTLRGNLLAEIDAAITASGADLAVFAPAFPATGRRTIDGIHLVDGVPLAETLDGDGPESSHLPTLLADSAYPVVECPIARADRGPGAVRELLASTRSPTIVACDASTDAHLDTIARAAAEVGEGVERDALYVGSGGLARYVRLPGAEPTDGEPTDGEPADDRPEGPGRNEPRGVLGIAGSANPRTIEGVTALPDESVIGLDVARAVVDPDAAAIEASGRAVGRLAEGEMAVVTSVPDSEAIERAREAGRTTDLEEGRVGERIERALAAVAAKVYAEDTPGGLFLTGGATARRVLDALDTAGIRLTGRAIERGVPVGRVLGGRASGAVVVTKAGGFGTRRTTANCLASLREENGRW